jgi:glutamine amidotransferase
MIVIVEGCGTNIASIQFALKRLNKDFLLSSDPTVIKQASHVIIPGVSTAKRAMDQLAQLKLIETLQSLTQPVQGIWAGMQILLDGCEEGQVNGLGIFSDKVEKLPIKQNLALPHMGWNTIKIIDSQHPLLEGIGDNEYVYFVHSFAAKINNYSIATSEYGVPFSAIVAKNNFLGTQFHPERSSKVGERILSNFLQ